MDKPVYPIDLIAIRDRKEKIARSVIKSWNVNYVVPKADEAIEVDGELDETPIEETHEQEIELTPEQEEAIRNANEIFARLEAEKAADEAAKQAEIQAALDARAEFERAEENESTFNAATGSYSGTYGTGEVSDETRSQAADILAEKKDAVADLINSLQ